MPVVVVCVLLALAGVGATVRWGGIEVRPPWRDGSDSGSGSGGEATASPLPAGLVVRRYLWYLDLMLLAGLGSGLAVAGGGGRLVMRLLAVTAGETAQGRLTEAEEVVGRITVGGTMAFVIFGGIFAGLASAALFLSFRRWLPAGRLGGVVFGLALLVAGATRIEPLRANNPDFGLVGPGWLAVVAFTTLVLVQAMTVAAIAGRLSRALPLLAGRINRSWAWHAPLLLLVLTGTGALVLVVLGLVAVGLNRLGPGSTWLGSGAAIRAGRVALGVVAIAALPGFVSAVTDIVRPS
ncbi:MAG: hypothetical protein ACRDZW_08440 [Acidimicrobiales bacterium]